MDDKIFAFLTTTSGLIIGWSFNELSTFIKSYRENKKVFKQILYTQLEIRDIILKNDIEEVSQKLQLIISQNFPGVLTPSEATEANAFVKDLIQSQQTRQFNENIKILTANYGENLKALAEIDPFTTYYIAKKDSVLNYLATVEEYSNTLLNKFNQVIVKNSTPETATINIGMINNISLLKTNLSPIMRDQALATISDDIKMIASKIGWLMRLKVHKFLKKKSNPELDKANEDQINLLINNLKASVIPPN